MTDKEQFDGFMRLAEIRTQRATNRQIYEWKVTFALWALIGAAAAYFKLKPIPLWIGPVVLLVYAFFWLRAIYVAHARDNSTAEYYIERAISVLTPGHAISLQEVRHYIGWSGWFFGFLTEWGCLFQICTTAILLYFFYLFASPESLPAFLRAS